MTRTRCPGAARARCAMEQRSAWPTDPVSIDEHSGSSEGRRLRGRPRARDRALPRPEARTPALPRRGGRRRQDRDREGALRLRSGGGSSACNATRGSTSPPPSTSGTMPGQMMAIRLAEAGGTVDRDTLESDLFSERYLVKRPLLQALEPDTGGRAGSPDRRARPHRRGLRGLLARGAVRLPGHRTGTRHGQGGASAHRHHHVEPHPRDP